MTRRHLPLPRGTFVAGLVLSAIACGDAGGRTPAIPPPPASSEPRLAYDGLVPAAPASLLEPWLSDASRLPIEKRIVLAARPGTEGGHPAIAFDLRNVSGRPLRIWPSMLPWGNVHAIDVMGLTATGEPLIWSGPIVDPGPEEPLLLQPGDARTGLQTLETLPTLEAQLRATDVVVLWRYELRLDDAAGVTTGAVVFPRRGARPALSSR